MSYENQAIIGILTGEGGDDSVTREGCLSLAVKWSNSHHGSSDNCHGVFLQMQNIVEASSGRYKPNWTDGDMVDLMKILPQVDDTWRLYIVGHGIWQAASCSGVYGPEMAKLLLEGGLTSVKLISLIACRGAFFARLPESGFPGHDRRLRRVGDHGTYWYPSSETAIIHRFTDKDGAKDVVHEMIRSPETGFLHCFAGDFHYSLGKGFKFPVGHARRLRRTVGQGTYWSPPSEKGKDPPSEQVKVQTTVYARVGVTATLYEAAETSPAYVRKPGVTHITGRKMTEPNELSMDKAFPRADMNDETHLQALTSLTDNLVHKRPRSKIAYIWEGDKQVRKVVNYNTAALFQIDLASLPADDD